MFSKRSITRSQILTFFIFYFIAFTTSVLIAQTTGKLSGTVTDENGDPLIGANVLIEETNSGEQRILTDTIQ